MSKKIKKILTIEQLLQFCQTQNFVKFSSKDSGYQLAVSVPTTFEVQDNVDEAHRGMMKLKIKIFHDGINRNGSKVPHESADRAMKTIPDRPLLAAIHQLDNGEWDFEAHEMEFVENDDGEIEINYIEKQIGSFSSEPAFWEHDDTVDKDFVCAYAYVPREYTKACEIIERKKGTKNSVELSIDELSYDAKDKCLVLEEFYVSGSTLLGREKDGTEIGEGMLGSRADIAEFSKEVNSAFFSSEEKIIAMLESLDNKISNLAIKNLQEGGINQVNKFEQLLAQYGKSVEDIDFEYEGLSDEELEAKFAELFADENTDENTPSEGESESENDNTSTEGENSEGSEGENQENTTTTSDDDEEVAKRKAFALSLQDKISALANLVQITYEDADNEWYGVTVYDEYVVMHGYFKGQHYKQNYDENNGEFTLVGDRVQVYEQFLTQEEIDSLENMKSEFSALLEYKEKIVKNELKDQKMSLLEDDRFSVIKDTEAFAEISKNIENYSLEDLEKELKLAVADFALENNNFALKKDTGAFSKQTSGKMFTIPSKSVNTVTSKYGGIFSENK